MTYVKITIIKVVTTNSTLTYKLLKLYKYNFGILKIFNLLREKLI